MLSLELEDARAGMMLGQDILGSQGQLLLRAGTVLSDQLLRVLRANQVKSVLIKPATEAPQSAAIDAAAIEMALHEHFLVCDAAHPLIQELRRLAFKRRTEQDGGADDDQRT